MNSSNLSRSVAKSGRDRSGREAGAVLIVSLLILLAMTLIGVSSMDSAVMELKMSSTMQQQVVAMNRAEATLLAAETRIDTITSDADVWNFETGADGFYPAINTLDLEQANWSAFSAEAGPIDSDNSVDDDDSYVVEYLGAKPIPGETVKMDPNGGIAGGAVHTFRNTTRSASGRSVVRIIQSIYVTLARP
jgi:type IV pilus assembly protein PilX